MTASSTPQDLEQQVAQLRRAVEELQRRSAPRPPDLHHLNNVTANKAKDGQGILYRTASGRWEASDMPKAPTIFVARNSADQIVSKSPAADAVVTLGTALEIAPADDPAFNLETVIVGGVSRSQLRCIRAGVCVPFAAVSWQGVNTGQRYLHLIKTPAGGGAAVHLHDDHALTADQHLDSSGNPILYRTRKGLVDLTIQANSTSAFADVSLPPNEFPVSTAQRPLRYASPVNSNRALVAWIGNETNDGSYWTGFRVWAETNDTAVAGTILGFPVCWEFSQVYPSPPSYKITNLAGGRSTRMAVGDTLHMEVGTQIRYGSSSILLGTGSDYAWLSAPLWPDT